MKKFTSFFALFLEIFFLSVSQLNAQTNGTVYAYEDLANLNLGNDYELPSATYNYVETSSGNYTINAIWYLSEGNIYIPEKGINNVTLLVYLNYSGGTGDPFIGVLGLESSMLDEMQIEGEASINKHGKCHMVFHFSVEE